ncbi:DUF6473 family protein [Arenibacterium sp. CAU 1754]
MSFELPGANALDEELCKYGNSRLLFRGPPRDLNAPYVAFLGGSETFGKFVAAPFARLVEQTVGTPCVNLGCGDAGLDTFLHDRDVMQVASGAEMAVVQVMGAQNLTNRFYRVHPRRNDRFIEPSAVLNRVFGEVDFTEFNFNKHLLRTLWRISPERFAMVRDELQARWVARMRVLLARLKRKPMLLWLRYEDEPGQDPASGLGAKPALVTRAMLDQLADDVRDLVEVEVAMAEHAGEVDGMVFGPLQAPAAAHMIGPATHARIAEALLDKMPL